MESLYYPLFVYFLVRERSWVLRLSWLIAALAAATALTYLRLVLGFGSAGIPLAFYFPAIAVTTLAAGLDFGAAALLGSLILVWFLFVTPVLTWQLPTWDQTATLVVWTIVSAILVVFAYVLRVSLRQLSYNEKRYRSLVEVTSDIVWVTDDRGHSYAPNDAFSRITGMQWPEFAGRKWLKGIHEEDRQSLMPSGARADEYHEIEFRLWDATSRDWRWFRSRAVAIKSPQGEITEWITTMRDVHAPRLARERNAIILGESRHRLKNLIAIIDALAKSSRPRTVQKGSDVEAFLERFLGRLNALGTAADLALAGDHRVMELGEVIRATLAPFSEGNHQIAISGPPAVLAQDAGGSIALALHELATNAIKYGALSVPQGSVSLFWSIEPDAEGVRVCITWSESGGPPVVPPEKEGYGTRVVRAAASHGREAHVKIEYAPAGLVCRLSFIQSASPPDVVA